MNGNEDGMGGPERDDKDRNAWERQMKNSLGVEKNSDDATDLVG